MIKKKKIILILLGIPIFSILIFYLLYVARKHENAQRMRCASTLMSLGFALRMYANVHNGYFPPYDGAKGLELLRSEGFCEPSNVYICPSTHDYLEPDKPLKESDVSYMYFGGHTEDDPKNTIIMCDKKMNHNNYRNILFLDGTVGGYSNGVFMRYIKFQNKYTKSNKVISENELKKLQ